MKSETTEQISALRSEHVTILDELADTEGKISEFEEQVTHVENKWKRAEVLMEWNNF